MRILLSAISAVLLVSMCVQLSYAQALDSYSYDIGDPLLTDYFVDPISGSDDAAGTSQQSAWKTVQHAWNQIPGPQALTRGYRINVLSGSLGSDHLPNYWELKTGTATAPIILRANPGATVTFTRDINMANVSYFYLMGITIAPSGGGDAFHCEACDHLLIRGCTLNGGSKTNGAHETLKINQSQYVYIENNNILYADDNNIDFVGVQYGHIIGNRVHEAGDWCAYVKGGSAYLRIESNEFFNCGTGGFTAGQGSGFQFMTSPWLHYEAYDIKFINNIVHDTEGAAFGVNAGYNVLLAHNTAYKVGTRAHLVEVVFGERTCDGESDGQSNATCSAYNSAGGWGPSRVRTIPEPVGNRNVSILNNIIFNPSGTAAGQHFAIYGPRVTSPDINLTSPQHADTNVSIRGNIIWNGGADTPLGVEDESQGCRDSNPTCNAAQLRADNAINTLEPALRDPSAGDFRPESGSALIDFSPAALSAFAGGDRPSTPESPAGILDNSFDRDFSGAPAAGVRIVGAFGSADASLSPPAIDGSAPPTDPVPNGNAPSLRGFKVRAARNGKRVSFSVSVRVTSDSALESVTVAAYRGEQAIKRTALSSSQGSLYTGRVRIAAASGSRVTLEIEAHNAAASATKRKSVTAP